MSGISVSLRRWRTDRARQLDGIAAAHAALGGQGRGRRWATHQINQAYAMLLSSQFQGFTRDLHTECVDQIVRKVAPVVLQTTLRAEFSLARKLDRGNPSPGNIGSDFARLGVSFWHEVWRDDGRNTERQRRLEELNDWRNAIAHQDIDASKLRPSSLTFQVVRNWRGACDALADSFDRIVASHVRGVTGAMPW